jgi:Flp pilus assembly protein TadD
LSHDPLLVKLFAEAMSRQSRGEWSSALLSYRRIQGRFPDFAGAWTNGSVALFEMGRLEEALAMARRAIGLDPRSPSAHCAAANALWSLGRPAEAAAAFRSAILLDPSHTPALTNLAGICADAGDFAQSQELHGRAVAAKPENPALWGNRAGARLKALDVAGAEDDCRRALDLDAGSGVARWNLAMVRLLQGRYREAWPYFAAHGDGTAMGIAAPRWSGGPLDGGALLVYTERHGFGDAVWLARFFPEAKRRCGGRLLLLTFGPMRRLLDGLPGLDGLYVEGEPLPGFDAAVHLMELPVALDIDSASLPPPAEIRAEGGPPPGMAAGAFKIGLVWAGSPGHANDAHRSLDPRLLDGLADVPGAARIAWYGLQKPPSPDPPRLPGFTDLSALMGDFMDTARIAKHLDLLVSVDTSTAHVAGSLGVPTVLLLPYLPDWRWGLASKRTPWYPSFTLLRQPRFGDWAGAVEALKEEIRGRARGAG